jgi:hypothetical protein
MSNVGHYNLGRRTALCLRLARWIEAQLEDLQFVSNLSGYRIHFLIGIVAQKYATSVLKNE